MKKVEEVADQLVGLIEVTRSLNENYDTMEMKMKIKSENENENENEEGADRNNIDTNVQNGLVRKI